MKTRHLLVDLAGAGQVDQIGLGRPARSTCQPGDLEDMAVSEAGAAVAEIKTEPQQVASAEPPSAESPDAIDAILSEAAGELSAVSMPAQEEPPVTPSEEASAAEPEQVPATVAEPAASSSEAPAGNDNTVVDQRPPDEIEKTVEEQDSASVPHLDPSPEGSPAESQPAGATPSGSGAGSVADGPAAKPLAPRRGAIVFNVPMMILAVLDKPFANLSMGTKNVLGYIGLATLAVAMATWLVGFFIRPT